jgi:hypothetical protein
MTQQAMLPSVTRTTSEEIHPVSLFSIASSNFSSINPPMTAIKDYGTGLVVPFKLLLNDMEIQLGLEPESISLAKRFP